MSKQLATAAAVCLLAATSASAFAPAVGTNGNLRHQHSSVFTPKAVDENGNMVPDHVQILPYYQANTTVGDLLSPAGDNWFYTLELDADIISQSPYFTDYSFKGFTLKVFNEKLELIGATKGQIELPEGASKCQSIIPAMQVTSTFFDTNSATYEVMMIANFNPAPPLYGAKQYTYAYTLQPTEPAEAQKPVFSEFGYYVAAINASANGSENFVLGFAEETSWDNEDVSKANYTVYRKAEWGKSAQKVQTFTVDVALAQSDGLNQALPFVMGAKGNDVYIATSNYEKTFLKDPTAPDPELNPDNKFIIHLFKSSGNKYEEIATTKIPCTAPSGDFLYRSYALGNFSGVGDITFDFGNGTDPCYIVSIVDTDASEESTARYTVFDIEGNAVKTFGEESDGYVLFSDITGKPQQYGFDMESKDGDYGTVLIDYPSLEEVGFLPKIFENDGDLWNVISVPDRVLVNGKVLYACTVMPSSAASENEPDYIGWFNQDGSLHHVDTLDFGEDAAKVLTYVHGSVLNPYLFNTDNAYEYLSWVYRWKYTVDENGNFVLDNNGNKIANGTSLELVVANSKGKILATRKMPEKGQTPNCYVANSSTYPFIVITYQDFLEDGSIKMFSDFIKLPLNKFEGEGTAESPYLIKTWGDLDQVRNNLTGHFRLANSIDCEGQVFRPVEGSFSGSIDGNGFEISNLTIAATTGGDAMFQKFGLPKTYTDKKDDKGNVIPGEQVEVIPARTILRDITFRNIALQYDGNTLGLKNLAFVANEASYADFSNVKVVGASFTGLEQVRNTMGVLTNTAKNTTFTGCAVAEADLVNPRATALAGLAATAQEVTADACFVKGTFQGSTNVAGLIANINANNNSAVRNCRVDANVKGDSNVAGAVAHTNRSVISNVMVSGTLEGASNVGGIAGTLDMPETDEPADFRVIDNCVVALSSITCPEGEEFVAAHRVIGYSRIDAGEIEVWVPDPKDPESEEPETGKFETRPAAPDAAIGTNYVISSLAAIGDPDLATEGTTVAADKADETWFEETAKFAFGMTAEMPWSWNYSTSQPRLYFEQGLEASLIFVPGDIEGTEGETLTATLRFAGVDLSDFTCESSDSSVADMTGADMGDKEDEAVLTIELKKEGTATFTATCGSAKAVLYVTVLHKSGINDATVATAFTYDGTTLRAEGCDIAVFDIRGARVAAGNSALATTGLSTGLYVARATAADGTASVMKINVK